MCSIPGLPSVGSTVPILITRVNLNPSCVLVEFWGNFDQDRKFAYQQLKKKIQYPKESFCETDGNPGDLCLARVYETWYRARIVSRDTDEYSVFLIDEGRTLRATLSTLAWGNSDFFYLPPEVEFCVLANVLPLSAENRWSAMALEFMKTFCGRRVNASVQDVLVPHRTFLLDIPCLSRPMFEMGFAKKLYSDQFKEFVGRSLQPNSGTGEFKSLSSVQTKPVEIIEQTEKQQAYMYPELQTDTVETVVVTEVTSPIRIFCQLKVFSQELKKLTEHITQHYEGRIGSNFARPENLGSPCASRGSDGKWYRSVLQQVMSANNVAEVLQVDYGKKQFVQFENVKPLASEFFRMPVVTYVCSLHGIADRGVGWTASQIDYLKSLLLNRTVIAKFQYQSLSEGVHYVTLYGEENTNINHLFEMKQNCSLDSMTLADFAIQKSLSSQKSKISVTSEDMQVDENYSDPKGNKPVFFTENLTSDTSHVVVVQHIDSPGKFWVQTQRYADEFNQLMNGLEDLYSDPTSTEGLIRKPVVGLLCAAKAQDDVFYRAAIYKVMDKTAEVYFLDYGNTEIVDCFSLRELPLRFQKLPAVAVKCSLHGIKPKLKHWDERATSFFSKLVVDQLLDLQVQDKQQDTLIVQLVDPSLDGENDVGTLLCNADFAVAETSSVENSAARSCGLKPHMSGIFFTGVQPQTPSSSSTLSENSSAFKEYLFPIGSSLEVIVSYIESPNDFWCQKAQNTSCLEVLMQDIQRFYAHSEFQPPLEAACVARHPDTGIWYRALVIQKHQTPHVEVLFIDYGQTKKVPVEDLRKISPAFLKMKGQAFRCSLYNLIHPVSHSTSDWSPEATWQFQDFVDRAASKNIPLKCTIFAVMYDSQKVVFNVVDLETPFQSICNLLVQKHLADRAPSKRAPHSPFRLDTYYYSTHGVKTGSEEEVSITCVKSVNEFFCHLARNSDKIEDLADKVKSLCRQLELTKCPQTFGTVCFAKYTDGLWYRGRIKSTKPIMVNFVDYGDSLEVDKSDLLPVPIEAGDIMSVPVQAIKCGLSDMPEDVPIEVTNWFQNFADGRCFNALIVAKEPEGKLIMELYEGKTQVNALIKQKFHKEIHKNQPNTFQGCTSKNRIAQSMVAHVKENTSSVKQELLGQVPQSAERLSAQRGNAVESKPMRSKWGSNADGRQEPTRGVGTFHSSHRQHEPQKISSDGAEVRHTTSDKTEGVKPKYQALLKESGLPVKLIKPGLKAEVFISHCNSPCSFFIQFASDEDDIYSLVEKLNADQPRCANIDTSHVLEGDLICAMFPDDNSWYRAAVRKKIGDKIDVEFVDFGNTAVVSASKICRLDQSYASFPRYSIHCSVHKLNAGSGDQESAPNFKQVLEENIEKVMCMFVKMSGNVWEVKLEVEGVVLGSSCHEDVPTTPKLPTHYRDVDITAGQMITGYTSCIKGPQLFWCQDASMDKLQEISEALQNTGNASEKMLSKDSVPVGSACIALYAEDNLWYRAKVTSRDTLDTLSITFVDYGNESKVNMGDVKTLPPQLSDVPPQAFSCQLDGFDLSSGFWDEKADDAFFELVNDKLLNINVEKMGTSETPHFVKLDCEGVVINDQMRSYWKSQSTENLRGTELVTDESVADKVVIDSVVTLSTETDHADDETCNSVLEMQLSEQEPNDILTSTEVEIEVPDDPLETTAHIVSSPDEVSVVPSEAQEDPETTCITEEEPVLSSTDPSDITNQHAFTKETEVDPPCVTTAVPQHPEETSNVSSVNIDSLLIDDTDSQLCIEEPQSTSYEVVQSDLGYLRQVTEKLTVGSECVIWSHARRNWCKAQILKVYEDSALVLLVEHDSEVVVDPLSIFEILPEKPLQTSDVEAAIPSDEVSMEADTTLENSISKAKDGALEAEDGALEAEDGALEAEDGALEAEDGALEAEFIHKNDCSFVEEQICSDQKDPVDELPDQAQDEGCVSCSVVSLEDSEDKDALGEAAQGHELVQVLSEESTEELNASAAEEQGDGIKMTTGVESLIDFLHAAPCDEVQDACETELETNALLEEFNNVTEELIVLTSDDGAESDTASDSTLQGDVLLMEIHADAEESACVQEISNASDCQNAEESQVTHLTLKVEDTSDDVIFVGVLQESQPNVCESESEKEKEKLD